MKSYKLKMFVTESDGIEVVRNLQFVEKFDAYEMHEITLTPLELEVIEKEPDEEKKKEIERIMRKNRNSELILQLHQILL